MSPDITKCLLGAETPLGENSCLSHSWWSQETQALFLSSVDGLELSLSQSQAFWANLRVTFFFLMRYLICSFPSFFLAMPGLCCCSGFSLVVASRLLTAVASLLVELGLQGAGNSVVVAHGLSSFGPRL